jgi:hypothetical protein
MNTDGRTPPSAALLLLLLLPPQDTDLVLVEYSMNGCRGDSAQPMCSSITSPRVRTRSWPGRLYEMPSH